jgi:hypothetical protein
VRTFRGHIKATGEEEGIVGYTKPRGTVFGRFGEEKMQFQDDGGTIL